MSKKSFGLLALLLMASAAQAALDETLRVKESIEINAPADKVWAIVGNFGDMGAWHPAIAKTEITSGKSTEAGATRVLTLKDGGTVHETLTAYDAAAMTMKYDITESVLPVREYSATLKVDAAGDKSIVTWRSMFKRKDPNNPAQKGQDDEAAKNTITEIFKSGLEHLKKTLEK
ncbi:MAG: SRPBCC family protein [Methylophilaceae bacterium]|nr:SRPBCC family protein [Methylophilaceae bacterium]